MRHNNIRYNKYNVKKLSVRLSGQTQQIRQKIQPLGPEVPQKLEMSLTYGFIQPRQQFQPLRRNPRPYCPPILTLSATGNQRSFLQPVEQPRNIRIPRHHAVADLPARKSLRDPPQNPQHVVLCRRKILGLQHLRKPVRQSLHRSHHLKVSDLLWGRAWLWLEDGLDTGFHLQPNIIPLNNYCQEE
jgi:hypothetical protein